MSEHPPLHTDKDSGVHISDGHIIIMYEDGSFDKKAQAASAINFALNGMRTKLINLKIENTPAELEFKRLFPNGVPEGKNLIDYFAEGMGIKRKQAEIMANVAQKITDMKFTNDREIERLETVAIRALENLLKENV